MTEQRPVRTQTSPLGAGHGLVQERSLRGRLWTAARVPPLGAVLGGASVGLLESLYINFQSYGSSDWSGLVYAVLLYGIVGLLFGLGLSAVAVLITFFGEQAPSPARSWTLSYLVVACSMSLVIGRFVLRRDLFAETTPPLGVSLGLSLLVGIGAILFYMVVKNALAKTFFSFMTHIIGSGTVYTGLLLLTLSIGAGNCLSNRAGANVAARPVAPELAERPNILLVVVDTLRADALSPYGADPSVSPEFAALAEDSMIFEQAFAPSPWTRPSFASLLTSTLPTTHQTIGKADQLPDELETLAERLRDHGYTTGAVVNNINITSSFNFHQGFDTFKFLRPSYLFRASQASFRLTVYQGLRRFWEGYVADSKRVERYYWDAERISQEGMDWITRHGRDRWFLMLQYMDPHDPYFPHPYDGTGYARVEHPEPELWEAESMKGLYLGEVEYWDQHFGRLLDFMEERGLLDNTLIVVTSDHGEEFGEHGGFWHGTKLYDESIRVPLLVRPAGGTAGKVVRDPVRLIDIAPTAVQAAGAEGGPRWQGVSLLREYALRDEHDRLVVGEVDFEGVAATSLRTRDWKLIRNEGRSSQEEKDELYYLRDDPIEKVDLATSSAAAWALERRSAELTVAISRARGQAVSSEVRQAKPSAEECEMLRSLGYTALAEDACEK